MSGTTPRISNWIPGRGKGQIKGQNKGRVAGRGSRVISIAGVSLAAAGLVAAAQVLPVNAPAAPAARVLPLSLGSPSLTCPGPETLTVPDGGTPIAPPAPVRIAALAGSRQGDLAVAGVRAYGKGSQLARDSAGTVTSDRLRITAQNVPATVASLALDRLGPVIVAGQDPEGADPAPQLAATQSTLARAGDLRGLAAVSCAAATSSAWLVGGATRDGERLRLLLSNPAQSPAVADIEVHGPNGVVTAPAGDGVVIPGERTVALFIDALAPGLDRVAVHVVARSGRVSATMHDSLLRGLAPGGVDDVTGSAQPALRQVIPGVSLVSAFGTTASDPDAAGSTSVRIVVPGNEEAVARVRLVDATGTADLPGGAVVNVPAGGVADVPLSGVASRTYTAIVESDVPVVASARVGRAGAAGSGAAEFGWASAARPVSGIGYVVTPPGTDSSLSLAAPDDAGRVEVRELDAAGQLGVVRVVDIPAGTSLAIRVSEDAVALHIAQAGSAAVHSALVSTSDDGGGSLITVLRIEIDTAAVPADQAVPDPRLGLPWSG